MPVCRVNLYLDALGTIPERRCPRMSTLVLEYNPTRDDRVKIRSHWQHLDPYNCILVSVKIPRHRRIPVRGTGLGHRDLAIKALSKDDFVTHRQPVLTALS
eukprot:694668-Rhodomonas_salina.1